jgi:hypothetical protein
MQTNSQPSHSHPNTRAHSSLTQNRQARLTGCTREHFVYASTLSIHVHTFADEHRVARVCDAHTRVIVDLAVCPDRASSLASLSSSSSSSSANGDDATTNENGGASHLTDRFATVGADDTLRVWSVHSAACLLTVALPATPTSVDWSPHDANVIACVCAGNVVLCDVAAASAAAANNDDAAAALTAPPLWAATTATTVSWSHKLATASSAAANAADDALGGGETTGEKSSVGVGVDRGAQLAVGHSDGRVDVWALADNSLRSLLSGGGDAVGKSVSCIQWEPSSNECVAVQYEGGAMRMIDCYATDDDVTDDDVTDTAADGDVGSDGSGGNDSGGVALRVCNVYAQRPASYSDVVFVAGGSTLLTSVGGATALVTSIYSSVVLLFTSSSEMPRLCSLFSALLHAKLTINMHLHTIHTHNTQTHKHTQQSASSSQLREWPSSASSAETPHASPTAPSVPSAVVNLADYSKHDDHGYGVTVPLSTFAPPAAANAVTTTTTATSGVTSLSSLAAAGRPHCLLIATADGGVCIYDRRTQARTWSLPTPAHTDTVFDVVYKPGRWSSYTNLAFYYYCAMQCNVTLHSIPLDYLRMLPSAPCSLYFFLCTTPAHTDTHFDVVYKPGRRSLFFFVVVFVCCCSFWFCC